MFFSISGIPPFSGFLAKFFIFLTLIDSKEFLYTLILILLNLIAIFYYIRLIKVIFFEDISKNIKVRVVFPFIRKPYIGFDSFILVFFSFLLIYMFFYPSFFLLICQYIIIRFF